MRALLLMLAAIPLGAGTYFVDPTGTNSATCGLTATPCRTISYAAAYRAVNPGDVVSVNAGTYTNEAANGSFAVALVGGGGSVVYPASGAAGSGFAITFQASAGAKPILDARSTTASALPVCGASNCAVPGNGQPCMGAWSYFDLAGHNYITIRGFRIINACINAIRSNSTSHDITIQGNEIDHIGQWDNQYGTYSPSGLDPTGGESNWTVYGNDFHDIGGSVNPSQNQEHHIYTGPGAVNLTFINNIFELRNDYVNNTASGPRGYAMTIHGGTTINVVNNTFVFSNPFRDGDIILWEGIVNLTIRNNIFFQAQNYAIATYQQTITNGIIDHNLIYPAHPAIGDTTGFTVSNTVTGNPNLTNTSTLPYNFQATPPGAGIDAGLNVGVTSHDYLGIARPQPPGGVYDIGAYEYVPASSCVISPITLGPWTNSQIISQTLTATAGCGSSTWTLTGTWPPNLTGCNTGTALTCTVAGTISAAGLRSTVPTTGVLAWQDTANPVGTTYNVYRSSGTCASPGGFALVTSGVTAMTYSDGPLSPGRYCWQVTATSGGLASLPSNSVDGFIPFSFTPTVAYGTASNPYTILVNPAPQFLTTTLPGGQVGAAYSQTLAVSGGTAPVTCSISAGTPPAGITLSSTCVLSGSPSAPGTFNFIAAATDSNGVVGTTALSLVVGGPPVVPGVNVSGGGGCGGCRAQ